jgi:hypothetical protein
MTILEKLPVYRETYGLGWTGFISRKNDFIAAGINWFSHWSEISGIPITHTFIIAEVDKTIEALSDGVVYGSLEKYLNDPDVALLVRQPVGYTLDMGQRIVDKAVLHIGEKYNNWLIAADAISNTFLGHYINHLTHGRLQDVLTKYADTPTKEICSKLVALAMNQHETAAFGVLANPAWEIKPIDLWEDEFIYQPGATELVSSV